MPPVIPELAVAEIAGGSELAHPARTDLVDDELATFGMSAIDRDEHVGIVAGQVEQPCVELYVEVGRDHPVGVDDEIPDFANLTPVAVDDPPAARIRLVRCHVMAAHPRQTFVPRHRRIVIESHGYALPHGITSAGARQVPAEPHLRLSSARETVSKRRTG